LLVLNFDYLSRRVTHSPTQQLVHYNFSVSQRLTQKVVVAHI